MSKTVFVYGTLKRGFGNHHVLCSSSTSGAATAEFVGLSRTRERFPLFVDSYCVPYLVDRPGTGHCIAGELYRVPPAVLERLDELEGVTAGRYTRRLIPLVAQQQREQELPSSSSSTLRDDDDDDDDDDFLSGADESEAWAYLLPERPGLALEGRELLDDYALALHTGGYVAPGPKRDPARRQSWGGFD